jgi:fatty-acyl-CoA synthase
VLHTLTAGLALGAHDQPVHLGARDVYMPLTPMFHVHAWGVPYLATLLGLKQVYPGRYEPSLLCRLLREHRVTLSHCVPTILQMLLHTPDSKQLDLSGWKVIIGGAALPPALAREAMDRGIRIAQGYGMSETCPIIAVSHFKPELNPDDRASALDIVGRTGFPIPLVEARVRDPQSRELPPGKANAGELVLRAPWLTPGYYRDPEASRQLWRDGWLHTGDMAYLDEDGYIRITDRIKDVIKIGGEWISSLELESALMRHEAVKEVAVVGISDARWGERPLAAVVLRETHTSTNPKEIAAWLHALMDSGALHRRAVLTRLLVVAALPRTSVGKIDKKVLRASYQAGEDHAS